MANPRLFSMNLMLENISTKFSIDAFNLSPKESWEATKTILKDSQLVRTLIRQNWFTISRTTPSVSLKPGTSIMTSSSPTQCKKGILVCDL